MRGAGFAIYVHIPICAHKCYYCDFHSRPVKSEDRNRYLRALGQEIRESRWKGDRAQTLFLGGGTPSELTGDEIEAIIQALEDTFDFASDSEWTIECNPGTVSPAACDRLLELGFDRISLGVQSFQDHHLKRLGRIHSAEDALQSYEWFRGAGFENVSLDLMFGLPDQTVKEWREDLKRALQLGPEHLSLYSLSIEPGTPFGHLLEVGALPEASDDLVADMYEMAMDLMQEAGYGQYEISNYALPGYECVHNLAYWTNSPYLGFGISAASYADGFRWTNTCDWEAYFEGAEKGVIPSASLERLQWNLAMGEEIMLGLRMGQGISTNRLSGKYRCDFERLFRLSINFLTEQSLLARDGDRLLLTRRGKLLANEVCSEFLKSARAISPDPTASLQQIEFPHVEGANLAPSPTPRAGRTRLDGKDPDDHSAQAGRR
ncbi:MAG: radical SAM family heme chaperone HemW [Acidobacteriota bacterium]